MIIFAWVLFIGSACGIVFVLLSKVSEVLTLNPNTARSVREVSIRSFFLRILKVVANQVWHFILEAKDLRPKPLLSKQVERVKNVFRVRIRRHETEPDWLPEATQLSVKPAQEQNAEAIYLEAIKKDPNDRSAYEGLAQLYLQEKNYLEAAEAFKFLTSLDPSFDVYFSNLGLCYYFLGDYRAAITAYEQSLNLNNKIVSRWINLALCFQALEEHPKAIKAVLTALEMDRNNISYLMLLADLYTKVENKIRGEEVLQQILMLDPTHRVAREKLMRLKI